MTIMYCPKCSYKLRLRKRSEGYVCKNWKCDMYWKMQHGPIYKGKDGWMFQHDKEFSSMKIDSPLCGKCRTPMLFFPKELIAEPTKHGFLICPGCGWKTEFAV